MLESLKRALFAGRSGAAADSAPVADWARRRGLPFKRARGDDGFVVEGAHEGKTWRLEWGPPQREYIGGRELRLRIEAVLPSSTQMLLLTRELMAALEHRTFEDYTDTMQTQVGAQTPEEMRWLVMFPKVDLSELGDLRRHFGAVASVPANGMFWVYGALGRRLEKEIVEPGGLLHAATPFVLMTLRGRVYLRMRMDHPDPRAIAAALEVFEIAVTQALQVAGQGGARRRGSALSPPG